MAQRRMFSKTIISSARFLKMPIDSQNLYFHLGMNADDDGIVEAFPVMRMVGSNEDNLRVLVSRNFIRILNDDLVSFITDWTEHNLIRADRKVDSAYKNLLLQIIPEIELKEQKARADTGKPTGRPMDDKRTAQVRLGKDSIGKDSIGKREARPGSIEEVITYMIIGKKLEPRVANIEADSFLAHYEMVGWKYGKGHHDIKDWRRAVDTWCKNMKKYKPNTAIKTNEQRIKELNDLCQR